jgi:GGDEF domain-containing protein
VSVWESTTWIAVGASALTAVLLALALVLAVRLRRLRHFIEPEDDSGWAAPADLGGALDRAREEAARAQLMSERAREESERARSELGWLRHLSEVGTTVDLEDVLQRALEAATHLGNAAAAMIVLARDEEEPLVATAGLSQEESSRELLGLPPEGGPARAVTLTYRYSENEMALDEFRLRGGVAVPITDGGGQRTGTLAIFWRRVGREIGEEELLHLEALTQALTSALENAFRVDELRRLADVDPATGLYSRRFLHEALARECARARRYERRLSLLLLRVAAPATSELLAAAGRRLAGAVRAADLACHLEEGRFAVVLPEAALVDAERLHRRLRFALGSKLGGNGQVGVPAGIVELRSEDDPISFLQRAESALARDDEPGRFAAGTVEPRA